MIRANLKAGAQGVVESFQLSNGILTIPNSATAQAVTVSLQNQDAHEYTLTVSVSSGTVLANMHAVGESNINSGGVIITPDGTNDVTLSISYDGGTTTCYYTITP